MRVVMLTYHFLPRIGGVEIATHQLATALVRLGVEVSVVAPQGPSGAQPLYRLIPLPRWRGVPRAWRAWAMLARLRRRYPFHILAAQMLYPAGYDACRFGQWANIPVVVTPQGADIHVYEPLGYGLRLKPQIERRIRWVLHRAAAVVVSNGVMYREVALLAPGTSSKMVFIPNGTMLDRFCRAEREALRRRFGVAPEEVVFITVSRHSPVKGLPILLQAVRRLWRQRPQGWRVWIAGVATEHLRRELSDLPRVELLGESPVEYGEQGLPLQPPTAIVHRLLAADVYVAPALSGGFELSCADALAAGLPLIVCRTNGAQDIVRAHGVGLVVPPADPQAMQQALYWMLHHPAERQEMGQRAREVARSLDWQVLAQRYRELFTWVLQQRESDV